MLKFNSLYTDYQELLLDLKINAKFLTLAAPDMDALKQDVKVKYLIEQSGNEKENYRYNYSRKVADDYNISYNTEMEFQEGEELFDLWGSSSQPEVIEPSFVLKQEYIDLFAYENNPNDTERERIIDSIIGDDLEEFKGGITETERLYGSVKAQEAAVLTDEQIDNLSRNIKVDEDVFDSNEGIDVNSDSVFEEGEEIDLSEDTEEEVETDIEEPIEEDIISDEDEYEEPEEIDLEEDDGYEEPEEEIIDEDEEEIADSTPEEVQEETSEEEDISSDDTEEEEIDEDDGYEEPEEEIEEEYEEEYEEDIEEEVDEDEETEEEEPVDEEELEAEEEIVYEEEVVVNKETSSNVVEKKIELQEFYDPSDDVDDVEMEFESSPVAVEVQQAPKELKGRESPPQQTAPPKPVEPPKVEAEPEPTDIRQFLRKHPNSDYDFVLKYFSKKQIEDSIRCGKIVKVRNKLKA